MVILINTLQELNKLSENSKSKKVIIDFFANWCGPCKKIAPEYIKLSEKYPDIEFCKCDVDEATTISEVFNINSLPTFIFLSDGNIVNTLEGADLEGLNELIKELNDLKPILDTNKEISVCDNKELCCDNKEASNDDKQKCVGDVENCNKDTCECECKIKNN
jgi:thioredoxin 1